MACYPLLFPIVLCNLSITGFIILSTSFLLKNLGLLITNAIFSCNLLLVEVENPVFTPAIEDCNPVIDKAFDMSVGEADETYIALVGNNLRKLKSSFDTRDYGFKKLTDLFKSLKNYEISEKEINGVASLFVRRKTN